MGLFGSIGSAISSGLSAVGGWISSGVSAISNVVGGIGRAISAGVKTVVGIVGAIGEKLVECAPKVANFVGGLLRAVGIMQPTEKTEEFGERILQAQERGIRLERAEEFDAYLEKLRSFELDPEKAKTRPQSHQLAAAMSVGAVGLGKRFDVNPEVAAFTYILPIVDKSGRFFTPERVQAFLSTRGLIHDISDYLEGRLSPDQALSMAKQIHELERRFDPTAELAALREELAKSREEYEALRAKLEESSGEGASA